MGALLVAAVVAADTAMASVEWGRRRALGASRSQLVALATFRVGIAAVAGTAVGVAAAVAVAVSQNWAMDALFVGSVATLAVIAAIAAAFPPAVRAAWRDPVSVLRTP
jgi:putative ABC transport system permease protein